MEGFSGGPLSGLRFVAKDIFDVQGHITGYGSPAWRESHQPANSTAPAVQALVSAGATLEGKALMDEMAFSLEGENHHYGTPPNPAAPGRIPGGSSSGSASAVASGEVDFGLGTDTAGSIRVPASYCGLFGFRPSHERVSLQGALPMAPSFDTAGWVTRDAALLRRVAAPLLRFPRQPFTLRRWLVGSDAFDLADPAASKALYEVVAKAKDALAALLAPPEEKTVAAAQEGDSLERWGGVFSTIQRGEVWAANGDWVKRQQPAFGPGVKDRYAAAEQITQDEVGAAVRAQMAIRHHVDNLLDWDGVLMIPTAAGAPAACGSLPAALAPVRTRAIGLTSIAGLCGLPQVTLPVARTAKGLVGLSLVGPRGADEALLELAERAAAALGLEQQPGGASGAGGA